MGKGIVDGVAYSTTVAYDFALFYERREKDRWALADICALIDRLPVLREELESNFGISITLQTLKNYARVSKSFGEEHRHLQYKWSNFLAWSKWDNPIKAMEQALDCGYSPRQMDNLRKHGDPNYKKPKPELCQVCGGEVKHCRHDDWMHLGTAVKLTREVHCQDDEVKG